MTVAAIGGGVPAGDDNVDEHTTERGHNTANATTLAITNGTVTATKSRRTATETGNKGP